MLIRLLFAAGIAFAGANAAAAQESLYGTLKKVNDSGKIVIGHNVDSAPFSFIGASGKAEGYSVDLCLAVVEQVKKELKRDNIEVGYVSLTPTNRIPLLVNGTVDLVCASTTNNLSRQRQIDYLATMFISGARVLTRKETGIKSFEDLKGKPVTVNQGSSNEQIAKVLDKKLNLGIRFIDTKDNPQAWISLETGRSDAHITDEPTGFGLIKKANAGDKMVMVGPRLSFDPFGIAIRRDDSAFRLVGNTALATLFRSGDIEKIYDKWMSTIDMKLDDQTRIVFNAQALPE